MGAYTIILKRSAIADLDALRKYDATQIANAMERHLQHDPTKESKSRIKRLRGISNPDYRLRIEDYLLQKSPRFRKMLDKVKRERASISLAEYRKSRGI